MAVACGAGPSEGSGSRRSGSTTTTGGGASGARVESLSVPATVACNGSTSVTVPVAYAVSGAVRQELFVDGRPESLPEASGTVSAPVHCDPLPHSVVVIAYDDRDRRVARSVKITTTP